MSGWGAGPWGAGPWGAGSGAALQMLHAEAIRENLVRVTFSSAPLFDRLHGPNDASNAERFQVVPDTDSVGRDGEPARPVRPVLIERADVAGSLGAVLDVWLDRPLSPWPTWYRISSNQLVDAAGGGPLDPMASSREFQGLYRELREPTEVVATPSADVANPADSSATLPGVEALSDSVEALQLGALVVADDGDYAIDSGMAQLRKRVLRRLLTERGAFAALPDYGLGLSRYIKRLNLAAVRQQLVSDARAQIGREPDVRSVEVSVESTSDPSLLRIVLRVEARGVSAPLDLSLTVRTG